MRVLDLFCGAGGAARGYADAGFEVEGWDIDPQPRYPFAFHRGDVLDVLRDIDYVRSFDFVHASPPCKVHTVARHVIRPGANRKHAVDLIPQTRDALLVAEVPFVIENTPGALLVDPVILCGSMFGLGVRRHRLFEAHAIELPQPECQHAKQDAAGKIYPVRRYHSGEPVITMSSVVGVFGHGQGLGPGEVDLWRQAMGIEWMTRDELAQAIPPAYTRWIADHVNSLVGKGF
jgi:DNA (cytosine-5)-methyltransferase 1